MITFFCVLFYACHSSTKVLCFILHIILCSWKHETGQSILIHIMQVLSLNLGILPIIMISYLGRGDLNLNQDKSRESKGNTILEAHHGIGTSGRRSSRSGFRQLTGTTIVNRYFHYSFLFFLFSTAQPFLIEEVLGSKNLFIKSGRERPKT